MRPRYRYRYLSNGTNLPILCVYSFESSEGVMLNFNLKNVKEVYKKSVSFQKVNRQTFLLNDTVPVGRYLP